MTWLRDVSNTLLEHDAHVEERLGVDLETGRAGDVLGEPGLVGELAVEEGLLEALVIGELHEALDLGQVGQPVVRAERLGDQRREGRVALQQPATRRDAVGDVGELCVGSARSKRARRRTVRAEEVDERLEHLLDEARVQGGDTVDLVRADDGEVGHAELLRVALCAESAKSTSYAGAPSMSETLERSSRSPGCLRSTAWRKSRLRSKAIYARCQS